MKATTVDGFPMESNATRHIVGLQLSNSGQRLTGVVLATNGFGLRAHVDVISSAKSELPDHLKALFLGNESDSACQRSPHDCAAFAAEIAELQSTLVQQLLTQTQLDPDQVLVIGTHDPGLWYKYPNGQRASLSLCDTARLAESTGLSVIDSFPARDLAQGGRGGPLWPLPLLVLFGQEIHQVNHGGWLVIELRRQIQIYYFPAPGTTTHHHVFFQTVQPGMILLDLLVEQLTAGQEKRDNGGRWAVQGRKIASLVDDWSQLDEFTNPPNWSPERPDGTPFLSLLQRAVHSRRTLQDTLCSATHLVADGICQAVHKAIPEQVPVTAGILLGHGRQNGMLLRELGERLPNFAWKLPHDFELDDDAIRAALVAILAMLHVDHVPGNLPDITGAQTPRILGRLTPGTPRHWRRLLAEMAANRPPMMTLRHAI